MASAYASARGIEAGVQTLQPTNPVHHPTHTDDGEEIEMAHVFEGIPGGRQAMQNARRQTAGRYNRSSELSSHDPLNQTAARMTGYEHSVSAESAVDLATSWLETIRQETLRDGPDLAGRVQTLINAAARHIHIRKAMQNARRQTTGLMDRARIIAAILTDNGQPVTPPDEATLDDVERARWNVCLQIAQALNDQPTELPPLSSLRDWHVGATDGGLVEVRIVLADPAEAEVWLQWVSDRQEAEFGV